MDGITCATRHVRARLLLRRNMCYAWHVATQATHTQTRPFCSVWVCMCVCACLHACVGIDKGPAFDGSGRWAPRKMSQTFSKKPDRPRRGWGCLVHSCYITDTLCWRATARVWVLPSLCCDVVRGLFRAGCRATETQEYQGVSILRYYEG